MGLYHKIHFSVKFRRTNAYFDNVRRLTRAKYNLVQSSTVKSIDFSFIVSKTGWIDALTTV